MTSPTDQLRVMLDANVLVSGIGWPRWSYAILQHAVAGDFQLVLSEYILEEARRHIGRIVPLALPHFEAFLTLCEFEQAADPSPEEVQAHVDLVRDKKDIPVALAALNAQIDCLVTSDRDLTESEALTRRLPVLLPAVFLRDHLNWTSEALEQIRHRTWDDLP
jgi:putative PIN family toxin of toxin-antitoxin system